MSKSHVQLVGDVSKALATLRKEIPETMQGFGAMAKSSLQDGALSELPAMDTPRWVRDPQFLVGAARMDRSQLLLVLPLGGAALMQLPDWLDTQDLRVRRWLDLASGEERPWPASDPDTAKVLDGPCLIELATSRVAERALA